MVFNMGKLLARSWGVDYGGDEYNARMAGLRSKPRQPVRIVPCGPPCQHCGDNSYACECK